MKSLIDRFFSFFMPGPAADPADRSAGGAGPAVENLEPRILFSAAPAPVEAPAESGEANAEPPATADVAPAAVVVAPSDAQAAAATVESAEATQEQENPAGAAAEAEDSPALPIAPSDSEVDTHQGVNLVDLDDAASPQLNRETLEAIAEAAAERWRATGLTAEQDAALEAIEYEVTDLEGNAFGRFDGSRVSIDLDAAGHGWFIDGSPDEDSEFGEPSLLGLEALAGSGAMHGIDLLSVVLHEQGHALGLSDQTGSPGSDPMFHMFYQGARRLPTAGAAEGAVPGSVDGPAFVTVTYSTALFQFDPGVDNQGWYSNGIAGNDFNDSYTTGFFAANEFRSFFSFDLAGLPAGADVTSATFRVFTYGVSGTGLAVDFFDVTTPASVINDNTGVNIPKWTDLGHGFYYGSLISPGTNQFRNVSLNATALAQIENTPGYFSLGADLRNSTGRVFYAGGATNVLPATLTITYTLPGAETTVSISGSDLVVTDTLGGNTDDNLRISRTATHFVIEDLDGTTVGTDIAGATQVNPSRVEVPVGLVAGGLVVNTLGGDDDVTLEDLGTLNGPLTITGGADQDRIVQSANATATLTGAHAVTFTAEQIEMQVGANLTTDTGGVTLTATGGTGNLTGVELIGASIDSTSGDVGLTGQGGDIGHYNRGIYLKTDPVTGTAPAIRTGGAITLTGTGGGGGNHGTGVTIAGGTVQSTGAAAVTIAGSGGSGLLLSEGVAIHLGSTIDAGTGDIDIDGSGGSTGNLNRGASISVSDLTTAGGNIAIDGTGGGAMTYGVGVELNDVDVTTIGTGTVTLIGTGAGGTLGNMGVKLAASAVNAVDGAITLIGRANGNTVLNHGIQVTTGTQIAATGIGAVTLRGTGGAGTTANNGIEISAASGVTVADGNLVATGRALGTISLNKGLDVITSTLTSTGAGRIQLAGFGSTAGTGVHNTGINFSSSAINTAAGNVVLNGQNGTGTSLNDSIRMVSSAMQSSGGGHFTLTGSSDGLTSGVYNTGVYLLSMLLDSAGVIDVAGMGGGGTHFNHGVYMQNITTPGSLPVTTGEAGGGISEDEAGNFFP